MSTQNAIQLSGVSKTFDGFKALSDADFTARWGEVHALLGENGAGKSSLMNIVAGLYGPEGGSLFIDDNPVKPYDPQAPETYQQSPEQLARYKQFANCINCGLCYSACPQFGLNPEFLGPAALTLAHRYNLDSRDHGKKQRMAELNRHEGVWSCTFVGFCSKVCPKHVDPAAAVNQGKVEAAKHTLIALFKG